MLRQTGEVWSDRQNWIKRLSVHQNSDGYMMARFFYDGKIIRKGVHRLVLRTFDRVPEDHEQCRHLNGVPDDNRLENLAWGTAGENQRDRVSHDTHIRGTRHPCSKLQPEDVLAIRKAFSTGEYRQQDLADRYGVSATLIKKVVRGECWPHVGGPVCGEDYRKGIKMLASDVVHIRQEYRDTEVTQKELANQFNLTPAMVSRIIRGKAWKNAGGPIKGEDY